jgi:protein-S-isoprenylcysteine O-methyltransferase Ste14
VGRLPEIAGMRRETTWLRRYLPLPRVLLLIALAVATVLTRMTSATLHLPPAVVGLGLPVVAAGLALIGWALWTLDIGMLGGVESLAPRLVTAGPYRWVRHPVYIGMVAALAGYGVAAASWPGLVATTLLVAPAAAYRARREEAALARKFSADWPAYRAGTGAWLPRPPRRTDPPDSAH